MGEELVVTLKSADGKKMKYRGLDVERLALESVVFYDAVKGNMPNNSLIKIPIGSKVLSMALDYCFKHAETKSKYISWKDIGPLFSRDVLYDLETVDDMLKMLAWDEEFIAKLNHAFLLELIRAAKHLVILGLLDLTCQRIADIISFQFEEEIHTTFGIRFDFTEEQSREADLENKSMFEGEHFEEASYHAEIDFIVPSSHIIKYLARRFESFLCQCDWQMFTTNSRSTKQCTLLSQSLEYEGEVLKKTYASIDNFKQQLFAQISEFGQCTLCPLRYHFMDDPFPNHKEVEDVEILLRQREVEVVCLANKQREMVDESIAELKNKLGWNDHLFLLQEECYSEIDDILHYARVLRVLTIQRVKEERELKSSQQEKQHNNEKVDALECSRAEQGSQDTDRGVDSMDMEEMQEDDDVHRVEDAPKVESDEEDANAYLSNKESLESERYYFKKSYMCITEDSFKCVIWDGRKKVQPLETATRLLLHQQLIMKNYELFSSVASFKHYLYLARDLFRKELEHNVTELVGVLQESPLETSKLAKDIYANQAMRITHIFKAMAAIMITDVRRRWDDRTPGLKEAIWYSLHCKKDHCRLIDEIRRQVELVLEIKVIEDKRGNQGKEEVTNHDRDHEAGTSNAEPIVKRLKMDDKIEML